jgi:hypothetical protein
VRSEEESKTDLRFNMRGKSARNLIIMEDFTRSIYSSRRHCRRHSRDILRSVIVAEWDDPTIALVDWCCEANGHQGICRRGDGCVAPAQLPR